MRALLTMLSLATLAACGSDDGTGPSASLNLSGNWTYSETATDQVHSISCNNTGTINITQSGSTFSGTFNQTGLCTGPGGSLDNSGTGSITGGQISGSNISFQVPFCQYQGTITASNRMNGTSSCTFQEAGITFTLIGTWQASR